MKQKRNSIKNDRNGQSSKHVVASSPFEEASDSVSMISMETATNDESVQLKKGVRFQNEGTLELKKGASFQIEVPKNRRSMNNQRRISRQNSIFMVIDEEKEYFNEDIPKASDKDLNGTTENEVDTKSTVEKDDGENDVVNITDATTDISVNTSATDAKSTKSKKSLAKRVKKSPKKVVSVIRHRFTRAYRLVKEGSKVSNKNIDHYDEKIDSKGGKEHKDIVHDEDTIYINVIIRNSVEVAERELNKLAKKYWGDEDDKSSGQIFNNMARAYMIKIASIALAANLTPRRVAKQLSNDLYRLLGPGLARQGVEIHTDIEYREYGFFVLAVNILSIDWIKFIAFTHSQLKSRNEIWQKRREEELMATSEDKKGNAKKFVPSIRIFQMTRFEIIAQLLAWLHLFHWIISIPLCKMSYAYSSITLKTFIITSLTDDIYEYVEAKGMEMDLEICPARKEAAFMLAALRELREQERNLKKKKLEADNGILEGVVLRGPLLGPLIKADSEESTLSEDTIVPQNLEYVNFEIDLPVGFLRLRWALLHSSSTFLREAHWEDTLKYTEIVMEDWDRHNNEIGLPTLSDDIDEKAFTGAKRKQEYLMPKSSFIKANMAYETVEIVAYNDKCFAIKGSTRTPGVPYGGTFIAWSQIVVLNTGKNTCKMVCSVEAEFPNGPPMVAGQIRSGLKGGTAEGYLKLGDLIIQYADAVP